MKVTVVVFFIMFSMFIANLLQSEAHIAINIDPEDLDQISDFFQDLILPQNVVVAQPNSMCKVILKYMKKGVYASINLIGVTTALVGANLISNRVMNAEPSQLLSKQNQVVPKEYNPKNNLLTPSHGEMCQIDYGCHRNACWRGCHSNNQTEKLWCFTSPSANSRDYYHCDDYNDCFVCWECLEACHK